MGLYVTNFSPTQPSVVLFIQSRGSRLLQSLDSMESGQQLQYVFVVAPALTVVVIFVVLGRTVG